VKLLIKITIIIIRIIAIFYIKSIVGIVSIMDRLDYQYSTIFLGITDFMTITNITEFMAISITDIMDSVKNMGNIIDKH
jgi:hypothetical protein